jgi:hypothetical protein
VVAKVRETLTGSKQTRHRVYIERSSLKKVKDVEGKEQYRVHISNGFVVLKNIDIEVDSNTALETIRENIIISAKESLGFNEFKEHKPKFDERCSIILDQRKKARLQWL